MKDFPSGIQQRIANADPEQLNGYMAMFDRFLLYSLAAGVMPSEAINEVVIKWEGAVKISIDNESKRRTQFLESTPQGRLAKKQKQPDGEDLRLLFLETLGVAKELVYNNLQRDDEDEDEDENEDLEEFETY